MPRFVASAVVLLAALSFSLTDPAKVRAVVLSPGDIVVVGQVQLRGTAVFRIDPITGDRTIISNSTTGSGPGFGGFFGVAYSPDGTLLVTSDGSVDNPSRVLRVDPLTGNRTVVSAVDRSGNRTVGSGPPFLYPYGIGLEANGAIVVGMDNALMSVDPLSGNRALLSGDGVGSGPSFGGMVVGLAFEANGAAFAAGYVAHAVFRVDPVSGDRSILSDATHGNGPLLGFVVDVCVDGGSLFATSYQGPSNSAVFRVDIATGDRTIISSNSIGSGPTFSPLGPSGIAREETGDFVVTDDVGGVFRVDPLTGNRTVLSGPGVGVGPVLENSSGILVVPSVPEPATFVLFALALLGLVAHAVRRRG